MDTAEGLDKYDLRQATACVFTKVFSTLNHLMLLLIQDPSSFILTA